MREWVNIRDGMPEAEIECFLAQRIGSEMRTYPKLAEWDGSCWIDIDGETVENVEWWMEAPSVDGRLIVEKLIQCVENEHCENEGCCYFARLDELQTLLEYMKK